MLSSPPYALTWSPSPWGGLGLSRGSSYPGKTMDKYTRFKAIGCAGIQPGAVRGLILCGKVPAYCAGCCKMQRVNCFLGCMEGGMGLDGASFCGCSFCGCYIARCLPPLVSLCLYCLLWCLPAREPVLAGRGPSLINVPGSIR